MNKSEIIVILISSIGSISTAITAFLIFTQIKSNHDWNRRKTSQEVLNSLTVGEFPNNLQKLRIAVREKLNQDIQNRQKSYTDFKEVLSADELKEYNSIIIKIINILETISVYVKNSIVDEDICYNFSYTFFIDLYHWLKPYIYECRQLESNEFILAEYEYFALKWEDRLVNEKNIKYKAKSNIVLPKKKL